MKQELLIHSTPFFTRMASVEDGQVVAFRLLPMTSILGHVYWGKVVRLVPALNAAFIDIGLKDTVFLAAKDRLHPQKAVQEELRNGERICVQIRKITGEKKGFQVTRRLSFAGHLVLYMPEARGLHCSRQIEPLEAEALKAAGAECADSGGWVIRTAARERALDLKTEMQYWTQLWSQLKTQTPEQIGLLYAAPHPLEQWLCDEGDGASVWMDAPADLTKLRAFVARYPVPIHAQIRQSPGVAFERYGAEKMWSRLHDSQIKLPSGGDLRIQTLDAMTVIDVNSGSSIQGASLADQAFLCDLEAAHQIAREIRLRNLSGQIWIDFIDLLDSEAQRQILEALHQGLARDSSRWSISPYTAGGLVRITRQRSEPPIWELSTTPCVHCQGTGRTRIEGVGKL